MQEENLMFSKLSVSNSNWKEENHICVILQKYLQLTLTLKIKQVFPHREDRGKKRGRCIDRSVHPRKKKNWNVMEIIL